MHQLKRNCLMDNFYTQHVKQATRDNAVLDLVITSERDMIDEVTVSDSLATSDYSMILWNCQFSRKIIPTRRTKLNFRKASVDNIKRVEKYRMGQST